MNVDVPPVRIVVLASGNGSNLQAIINAIKRHELAAVPVAVVSDKVDAYALERARQEGIPAIHVDANLYASHQSFDVVLQKILLEFEFDLLVLAGFMRILTTDFVNQFRGRMMNIHPSLLPKHRGLNTHRRVLQAGDEFHGATVHFVTPELDAGPIILQQQFRVADAGSEEELESRVHECEHQIYPQAIQLFAEGKLAYLDE